METKNLSPTKNLSLSQAKNSTSTSQVDSELSTTLFGLPSHMWKRLGWEYGGRMEDREGMY